jgi:hypothetical protein
MANSKLLKEAIADAKAVKETALANAKIALEEAFTPRLQSILSQKMRAEAEAQDDDAEMKTEELDSSNIGGSKTTGETPGTQPSLDADTDLSVGVKKDGGKPEQAGTDYKKVADISEEENPFANDDQAEMGDDESDKDAEIAELKARLAELEGTSDEDPNDMSDEYSMDPDSQDDAHDVANHDGGDDMSDDSEDDMDLEAIIRELEAQLEGDDMDGANQDDMDSKHGEEEDESMYEDAYSDGTPAGTDKGEDPKLVKVEQQDVTKATVKGKIGSFDNVDETIDLDEILREMEDDMKADADDEKTDKKDAELNEAYAVIKSLQKTINEVNLLNAKLLFANKLFRANNMTNEQKVKVIETLDRTKSVREVKLVYSTLAENFRTASTTTKSTKKSMTEGIASKVTKSTSPVQAPKQVIAENADFANRFKKLAGILK